MPVALGEALSTHQFLRVGTKALHHEIEALSPLGALLDGTEASLETYSSILSGFAFLLGSLEPLSETLFFSTPSLVASPDVAADLKAHSFLNRRHFLAQDLSWLGVLGERTAPAISGELAKRFALASRAELWGLAYVLVGQSLGSLHIHRALSRPEHPLILQLWARDPHFEGQSDVSPLEGPPFSFLWGYGRKTSRFWARFLECLEEEVPPTSAQAREDALQGAHLAFEAFGHLWRPKSGGRATPPRAPGEASRHLPEAFV